jgi:carbon storage regulator
MLVLVRKLGQRITIGNDVELVVLEIHGNRVKLGIQGPAEVPIHRSEIVDRIGQPRVAPQCVPCG